MSTIEKAVEKLNKRSSAEAQDGVEIQQNDSVSKSFQVEAVSDQSLTGVGSGACLKTENEFYFAQKFAEISTACLAAKGMVTQDSPRSQVAEEYRVIKRPLLMNISSKESTQNNHVNLIMVTSCLQGEGKTFSAINLAMSMSMEKDKTVLFVDGDVSKASAGKLLGISDNQKGLINVLEDDEVGIEDVILSTSIPNLKIIPAGHIHERATELLASKKMLALASELSERYQDRVIIFDSPPLLLTTEARVLANAMGQIMFVVAAEQTSHDALQEGLEYISQDKIVGMVLNKAKHNLWSKQRYGYGYSQSRISESDPRMRSDEI